MFFTDIPTFGFTADFTTGLLDLTGVLVTVFGGCGADFTGGAGFAFGLAGAAFGAGLAGACFTALAAVFLAAGLAAFLLATTAFAGVFVLTAGLTAFLATAFLAAGAFAGAALAPAFFAPARTAEAGFAGAAFFTADLAVGFVFDDDLTPALLAGAFFVGFATGFFAPLAFWGAAFLIAYLAITYINSKFSIRNGRMRRARCQTRVRHQYGVHSPPENRCRRPCRG
ncbi:MAG: hypothetical protein ACK5Z2_04650 [Bacteroidota bacterium]